MTDTPLLAEAELAAIAERANKATPGPWYAENGVVLAEDFGRVADCTWEDEGCPPEENACFIAASREDTCRLLADLHRYREWCRRIVRCYDGEDDPFALQAEVRAALEESQR